VKRDNIHPNYVPSTQAGQGANNDIAILELSEDITFTASIKPACLPTSATKDYSNLEATISGSLPCSKLDSDTRSLPPRYEVGGHHCLERNQTPAARTVQTEGGCCKGAEPKESEVQTLHSRQHLPQHAATSSKQQAVCLG